MGRPTNGYRLDGEPVVGVTTVCSRVKKADALIGWAWKLGKEGKDYRAARDQAADAGTCAHQMVESFLLYGETRTDADGQALLDGIRAYKAWKLWWDASNYAVVELETSLVSREYRYGGTFDALLRDRETGEIILTDWKTGSSVYPEALVQCAAYAQLLRECREIKVDRYMIVNFTRAGALSVYEWRAPDPDPAWLSFLSALTIYNNDSALESLLRNAKTKK